MEHHFNYILIGKVLEVFFKYKYFMVQLYYMHVQGCLHKMWGHLYEVLYASTF